MITAVQCSLAIVLVLSNVISAKIESKADFGFLQDYAHRYAYSTAEDTSVQIPINWEKLPFTVNPETAQKKGSILSGIGMDNNCLIALNDGVFYSAQAKDKTPSVASMENPYRGWEKIYDTDMKLHNVMLDTGVQSNNNGTTYSLYTASKHNIFTATFTMSVDHPCGELQKIEPVLAEDFKFGMVNSLQYSPFLNTIFVGSFCTGITYVRLDDRPAKPVTLDAVGTTSSTSLWVEQWKTLFTADVVAFWTVDYSKLSKDNLPTISHEWIGGVLAHQPTDLAFDSKNDNLWIAEFECIHRLTRDQVYWRYGYQQEAPMVNITSVAVHDGVVYSGSEQLGMARLDGASAPDQLDATLTPTGDAIVSNDKSPWRWSYYFGQRYLPSNLILSLNTDRKEDSGHSMIVLTTTGMTYLDARTFTLAEKAAAMDTFQYPRHNRYGLSTPVNLDSYGALDSWHNTDGDNDGLWTSMSAMGMTYRLMASKGTDDTARKQAWRAFEGLEMLSLVTGAYPYYCARTFCKISDGDVGCPDSIDPDCVDDCWYNTHSKEFDGWYYKGDTSSDELSGHLAAYPMIYDHVARNDEERSRVLRLLEGITMGIIDNDLYLISPETGKRTLWGFWNPKELNDMPEHYSERGTNSLEILAWTASAYSITGNKKYKNTFWTLVNDHDYVANTINVKIDSAIDENHSDTELLMLSFHSLYYAYSRLDEGHERKQELKDMVSLMDPSIQRSWRLMRGEMNGLWLGIYHGTAAQNKYVNDKDVQDSLWSLRRWQLDNINWEIHGSQRIDLDISGAFFARNSNGARAIMRHIRPPAERASSEWNSDPFDVNPNGGGNTEYEPQVYLLPYYIMLYHNMVQSHA